MPVPSPDLKRVPRWRTMISPPVTVSPANTLTPRRFAFESRPLREEPRPFLCAIAVLRLGLGGGGVAGGLGRWLPLSGRWLLLSGRRLLRSSHGLLLGRHGLLLRGGGGLRRSGGLRPRPRRG